MDQFPLYPYHSDPLRILSPRRVREEYPAAQPEPEPPPEPPPEPDPPSEPDPPAARETGEPSEPPAPPAGPPEAPPDEHARVVCAWLNDHWPLVKAMALAGEAPQRPAPPPPAPASAHPEPLGPSKGEGRVHVPRGDRWNKPKMAEFLRQLAATHSVTAAAKAVGMSRRSAYKLRSRLKGQPFDIAWEAAFRHGYDELAHAALELALEGEEVPHYYQGELKATHRKRNPQLMVQLLKLRNRAGAPMLGRYGAAAEFWSENWEQLIDRVATGPVTWDAESEALGEADRVALDLPDRTRQLDRIIARNMPDEPKGPSRG
jgi:hypothetical protein